MPDNWNPDRHETVDAPDWSRDRAESAIAKIIDDVERAYRAGDGWPSHPRDGGDKTHGQYTGTAGNGWAMLKLRERTGDDVWLERARKFATWAIEQQHQIYEEFDRGWYSLWTGDIGLGAYLCSCLDQSSDWIGWERF